ncbi:stage II sporulation protein M [Paludifilum halophilum]|uniref:stage II sporulation protein M n=1 Tax=Paludifilum halophilum TaxID=1642702 RepID=UPI00146BB8E1|nr:stage II sporulation protein M [Paludifilum halophilum]
MSVQSAHRVQLFTQKHQPVWKRLESLLTRIHSQEVSRETLDELGHTYRQTATHLAYAQTYFPEHPVTRYLNRLVARAHQAVYGNHSKSDARRGIHFFNRRFPELFYERSIFFLIAALLFVAGALYAYGFTLADPDNGNAFLPAGMTENLDPDQIGQNQWNHAVVSSQIMTNNIKVAFLCFALGAMLGVGTVWVLFSNGLLIGALAALFQQSGASYTFWAFIWPHGIIELTAIFISGAAGLSLAYAFFVPGDRSRLESFKREGRVTVRLILGVIPMFIIAGLIEGFITPAPWPDWTKYLVALITLVLLVLYLGRPALNDFSTKPPAPSSSKPTLIPD